MKLPSTIALALCAPFAANLVSAGEISFDCTVTSAHAIAESGEVIADTPHLKSQVGARFTVDRKSGAIRGNYFINNAHSKETRVINSPQENTYYVLTVSHGPTVMAGYLYIGNHRGGAQKPFVYTSSGSYIYVGFCR
jgi:hypothetical protein